MRKKLEILNKYYVIIALIVFFSGCQSSVRFSSNYTETRSKSNSTSSSKKSESTSKTSRKIDIEDKEHKNLSFIQKAILEEADKWIGVPYCWGGENNNCVDCSGFVKQVFEKINIFLPRTAAEQYIYSEKVFFDNRQIADLVFFKFNNKISHVGIYIGNNEFVHSASSIGVSVQSLDDDYFKKNFAGYGRILKR
ncbi:MAG TPA: C40 family peptidase [Candidatus Kapabacteria bacterium]|nr:C40 family peptidase [Candidatus Kapabacteria bacterium]